MRCKIKTNCETPKRGHMSFLKEVAEYYPHLLKRARIVVEQSEVDPRDVIVDMRPSFELLSKFPFRSFVIGGLGKSYVYEDKIKLKHGTYICFVLTSTDGEPAYLDIEFTED